MEGVVQVNRAQGGWMRARSAWVGGWVGVIALGWVLGVGWLVLQSAWLGGWVAFVLVEIDL